MFITPDSFNYLDPSTLYGLDLYTYCMFNPVMYVDPYGKSVIINAILEAAVSFFLYVGMCVASVFDEDIRNDMESINWNPFNSNENAVVNSKKISFYKGVSVIRGGQPFIQCRNNFS